MNIELFSKQRKNLIWDSLMSNGEDTYINKSQMNCSFGAW